MTGLDAWKGTGQISLDSDLPEFSFSPQEYITQTGEYLMTLPQHLEPYMSGWFILQSGQLSQFYIEFPRLLCKQLTFLGSRCEYPVPITCPFVSYFSPNAHVICLRRAEALTPEPRSR